MGMRRCVLQFRGALMIFIMRPAVISFGHLGYSPFQRTCAREIPNQAVR
jgi:hypothetical protein